MSLYTQLYGENKDATILLGFANLTREMFPRYRDVFLADNGSTVIVYIRAGGDNRQDYEQEIKKCQSHPQYIEDYDDKEDTTYAYFRFSILPKYLETSVKMFEKEPMTVMEMMKEHIKKSEENPDGPERKKDMEIAERMMKMMESGQSGILFM